MSNTVVDPHLKSSLCISHVLQSLHRKNPCWFSFSYSDHSITYIYVIYNKYIYRGKNSFTGNAGLCGIPGLPSCGPHLSIAAKIGIAFGSLIGLLLMVVFAACWWKRRQNILRAQKIAAGKTVHPMKVYKNHFGLRFCT